MNENLSPYSKYIRNYVDLICDALVPKDLWESDLQKSFASSDFFALFVLSKEKVLSFGYLFTRFIERGWVAEKFKTEHIEKFLDLVDSLRYGYNYWR